MFYFVSDHAFARAQRVPGLNRLGLSALHLFFFVLFILVLGLGEIPTSAEEDDAGPLCVFSFLASLHQLLALSLIFVLVRLRIPGLHHG